MGFNLAFKGLNDSRNLFGVYPTKNISHKVSRGTCNTPFLTGTVLPYVVRGLSGKYPAILNISRTGRMTLM